MDQIEEMCLRTVGFLITGDGGAGRWQSRGTDSKVRS